MSTSSAEKKYQQEQEALKKEIERKTGKTTQQLYEEREKRISDAIELKTPDRIPLTINVNTSLYCGIKNSAAYYDPIGWKRAMRKITVEFEPDVCNAGLPTSGDALTALDVKNRLWPGGPLPPDYEYQFVESEFMKEDEYDLFLNDPSDFMIRYFLPRMYGSMQPLAKLPPLGMLFQGFEGLTPMLASPEFLKVAKALNKAGQATVEFRKTIGDSYGELASLGFPAFAPVTTGGLGGAPFDTVSSFLRGMKGSMLDMYRRPEKLLKLCDLIFEKRLAQSKPADPNRKYTSNRVGMPLWRGDKSFMSEKMFDKFYWPGLKKTLQASIDLGYVPIPFFEAEFGNRLERLLELPKGKIVASVEHVDAVRAKEILGGHTCIMVRNPLSSKLWTLPEVEQHTKELIDKCGKGGGIFLNLRLPDKGTKEEFTKMLDSIREYSRY
ncbi:MAG: uroporphyrinogen decarboxylase/cobalamine-independent methonine synthase family protein [Dehalococcoidales bacterium]